MLIEGAGLEIDPLESSLQEKSDRSRPQSSEEQLLCYLLDTLADSNSVSVVHCQCCSAGHVALLSQRRQVRWGRRTLPQGRGDSLCHPLVHRAAWSPLKAGWPSRIQPGQKRVVQDAATLRLSQVRLSLPISLPNWKAKRNFQAVCRFFDSLVCISSVLSFSFFIFFSSSFSLLSVFTPASCLLGI